MKKFLLLITTFFPFLFFGQQVNIIPQPVSLQLNEGDFTINKQTTLSFNAKNKDLKLAADFFISHIKNISGITLPLNDVRKKKQIEFTLKQIPGVGNEGYLLNVTPQGVLISANTKAGILYGLQTLIQTLPAIRTNASLTIPAMQVKDYPRFQWRGMHLDVSRHFFSLQLVKKYIDLMAAYKMNTFHWHLVDDPGWRIEIKKYPRLTAVGSWRVDETHKPWSERPQAKPGEDATYGGYYTQEQIKEIIDYAAQRNITIVPEIEMPGHVASAIASYPNLSCKQKPQLPLTGGDYSNISSNYCAGNDSVFLFLQDVLSEVIDLFPSRYIHIGGDEVDKTAWKNCARCQARIKNENLKDEEGLQSYFIKRIEKFVNSKNRRIIGWDEILEGGLAPTATVMSWRGEAGGIEAAKMNHDVIMTPGNPVYFDHYQGDPATEPLANGGFNTLKKVYDYEPIPAELNEQQAKHVLGSQANLWAEYITTPNQVLYMVLPRMLALSEVVWSEKKSRNWNHFNERLQSHFKAFDQQGLPYSKGNFKVDIKPSSQNGRLNILLSTEIYKGEVYYTIDGSKPGLESIKYSTPFSVDSTIVLKAVTVVDGEVKSSIAAQQQFVMHKAVGRDVNYQFPVSRYYMADGLNSLTDGVRGTGTIGEYWHGFSGHDLAATIDLTEEKNISHIAMGFLQHYKDWIFLPRTVKFELSNDGKSFREVETVINTTGMNINSVIKDFRINFPVQKARFIRVTAKNGVCPPGHPGEGNPAWIFADEIIIQ